MFGSADGKRFRDLAQTLTFSFLVEHANHHLRRLTSRYQLNVLKGTLALEVIDHDMLDEHRFVHSLSGGETFIVSLALALGLASLSSNTLNIGSLFIDEGFGNLDEESLDLVLTTLSALEAGQGRKVGCCEATPNKSARRLRRKSVSNATAAEVARRSAFSDRKLSVHRIAPRTR